MMTSTRFEDTDVEAGTDESDKVGREPDVTEHEKNAREVDKPIAGLLKDLKSRGLLDDTLVLWGGEFGRTPTVQ